MSIELYRCWHKCLTRSNEKKWSAKVKRDLAPHGWLVFDVWWDETHHLFEQLPRDALYVLESANDFDIYSSQEELPEIAVLINLATPKVELIAALQKLLDKHHKGKRGRPKRDDFSEWKITGRPNARAINKALEVYDAVERNPSQEYPGHKTLWEIGVDCKVNLAHIPKKKGEIPSTEGRRVLASTVSRYLKRANELIAGVEKGVFPA